MRVFFATAVLGMTVAGGAIVHAQQASSGPQDTTPQGQSQPTAPSGASVSNPAPPSAVAAASQPGPAQYEVPAGTRLPLILHNAITTRNARPGDPVYLETLFPIVIHDRILIPAGSYVQGEVQEAKRPGKVKGRGEVSIRLDTMILPNGYTVNFNAVPTNAGTGGNESTDKEGHVTGDSDKATDVGTVVKTTGIGAGVGGVAGGATGAGIGAGAGGALGLATVLLTRGPEMELPRGTTLDVVLDRVLYLDASRINFTDPGRASEMPGPPNREPTRSRSPF